MYNLNKEGNMKPVPDIGLTSYQRKRLEELRRNGSSVKVHKRASVILLSGDGFSAEKVSKLVGYSIQSVWATRTRWRQLGLAGLEDLPRPGRPPKVTDEYIEQLHSCISRDPAEFGYIFRTWSTARIAEHLKEQTKISIVPDYVSTLLKRLGYSYQRPKYTLRNVCNQKEYRKGKKSLQRLKKGP
jgi:transposase